MDKKGIKRRTFNKLLGANAGALTLGLGCSSGDGSDASGGAGQGGSDGGAANDQVREAWLEV